MTGTPPACPVIKGIEVISRYVEPDEMAVMREWVWALPPNIRPVVSSVFCDSQLGWCFTIVCRAGVAGQFEEWQGVLAEVLDKICIERVGGHNGITVNNHMDEYLYDLEPEWVDGP